jgi:hypothetical protein
MKGKELYNKLLQSFIAVGETFFSGADDLFYVPFAKFHRIIEERILRAKNHILIRVPRGFGKTKLMVLHAVWSGLIRKRKRNYLIYWSYSQPKSRQFVKDFARCIEKPIFRKVFKWTRHKPWSDIGNIITIKRKDGSEFRLVAMGWKQQGVGWSEGKDRPDGMYFDDLENPEAPKDLEINKAILSRVSVVLKGLASKNTAGLRGQAWFIGTPHYRGCVLDEISRWPDVEVITFPCLIGDIRDIPWEETSELLGLPFDASIWEEMWPTEMLHSLRAADLEKGEWAVWMAQMMCSPEAEESLKFDEKLFREISEMDAHELMSRGYPIKLTIDMAYSQKNWADHVGFSLSLYLPHLKRVVLESFKKKIAANEIFLEILRMRELYGPFGFKEVYVETLQFDLVREIFNQKNVNMMEQDPLFQAVDIFPLRSKHMKGKVERIGVTIQRHKVGLWLFVSGKCDQLKMEARRWTGLAKSAPGTDDCLDADAWHNVLMSADKYKSKENKKVEKNIFKMKPSEILEIYERQRRGRIRNVFTF